MRQWEMREHIAGVENAGVENAGVDKVWKVVRMKIPSGISDLRRRRPSLLQVQACQLKQVDVGLYFHG